MTTAAIILIAIPIYLGLTMAINGYLNKKNKGDSYKIGKVTAAIAVPLMLFWIIFGGIKGFQAITSNPGQKAYEAAIAKNKYTPESIATSEERIAKWQKSNQIKLDIATGKAYINALLWEVANVDQKKDIMSTIMIYTETKYGESERIGRFFSFSTDKQIASWSPISGYDLGY